MKKMKIPGLCLLLVLSLHSCEKLKDPAGPRNSAPVPAISDVNPGIFDSKDLVTSFVEFKVDPGTGVNVDKASIVASYNDNAERVEITQATSFPATIRVVSGDVIQKLGLSAGQVVNGDVFTLEVLLTGNGLTTRSNAVLNIPVACAFDEALTEGSYHTVSADWASEGNITLTADQTDPYKIYVVGIEAIEGVVEDQGPLVLQIDPATFEVTADPAVIASDFFGYHNVTYSGSGVYNSCDGSFEMDFDISVDEGSFGKFGFIFTKNP
jgi:hypothetical protein